MRYTMIENQLGCVTIFGEDGKLYATDAPLIGMPPQLFSQAVIPSMIKFLHNGADMTKEAWIEAPTLKAYVKRIGFPTDAICYPPQAMDIGVGSLSDKIISAEVLGKENTELN